MSNVKTNSYIRITDKKDIAKKFVEGSYTPFGNGVLLAIDKVEHKDYRAHKEKYGKTPLDIGEHTEKKMVQEAQEALRPDAYVVAVSAKVLLETNIRPGMTVALNKPPHYQPPVVVLDEVIFLQFDASMIMGEITDKKSLENLTTAD